MMERHVRAPSHFSNSLRSSGTTSKPASFRRDVDSKCLADTRTTESKVNVFAAYASWSGMIIVE